MKQRVRSVGARVAAPALAAIDRRLTALAVRLEAHTTNLAVEQHRRFDALDSQVGLDLRVVDEHLLAIERATAGMGDGGPSASFPLGSLSVPSLLLVVPVGAEVIVPDGYEVVAQEAHAAGSVFRLARKS